MRYDNQISLAVTIDSRRKDLSDLSREQVLHVFTNQINDLFDHGEFQEAVSLEDQIENTTYTVWFQESSYRGIASISESEMREMAERYDFDAEEVIHHGETFMWNEGVEPYDNPRSDSDDICGGCYKVEGGAG